MEAGVVNKCDIDKLCTDSEIIILREEQNLLGLEYDNIRIIDDLKDYYYHALERRLDYVDDKSIEPYYLQLSQAERNLKSE